MTFLDSSVLVAALTGHGPEKGDYGLLLDSSEYAIWALTPVECLSAIFRLEREEKISTEDAVFCRDILQKLREKFIEVDNIRAVRDRAERILAAHKLKSADALQLAAALVLSKERPQDVRFHSYDRQLLQAAMREGFSA